MGDEIENYARRQVSPELIEYLKGEVAARDASGGALHIHITPPAPPAKPDERPDVLAKYAPYLVLATWSALVFGALALALMWLATTIMVICGSLAVLALAVAGAVRSLRLTRHEVRHLRR